MRIALLLAFEGHDGFGGVAYETLVAEFFLNALQETFEARELGFDLFDFGSHVDEVAHRHGQFRGAHHKAGCAVALRAHHADFAHVGELLDDAVVAGHGIAAHDFEFQGFLLRDVLAVAHAAHVGDDALHHFKVGNRFGIAVLGLGNRGGAHRDALAVLALCDVLPQFLRDKRHEGVEQMQQVVEETNHRVVSLLVDGLSVGGLHDFEEAGGEFIPEEAVHLFQGFAQAVAGKLFLDVRRTHAQLCVKPRHGLARRLGLLGSSVGLPAFHEAEGVPNLVAEVASLLAQGIVEENIVASRCGEHHAHAHAVGAVFVNQGEGVGRVAELFRHFAAELVAHNTREVNVLERHLARVFVARHNHARHPEEDDVRPGHEVARGVIVFQFRVTGIVDAVEERDGPEPRREPRVERVLVLAQVGSGKRGVAALFACQCHGLLNRFGHHEAALRQIVSRYAVSPPKLARDAPILDIFQPMAIGILVFGGIELDFVVHHGRQGEVGKVLHLEEPLHGEFRLNGHARALGAADFVVVVLHLLHKPCLGEVDGNLAAHVEAILADVHAGGFGERGVVVEDVDGRQIVLLAEHIVVHVVRGRYFQAARAELDVYVRVLNHGNHAAHERHDDFLAFQPLIFRVFGVDAHRHVAHNRFGAGGGHHGVASALVAVYDFALCARCACAVVFGEVILHVVELRMLFLINHLLVGEGGLCFRIPVYHAHAAIDQAFAVEIHKHLNHALRTLFVHREGRAVPVARSAHAAQLLENDAAVFVRPVPRVL